MGSMGRGWRVTQLDTWLTWQNKEIFGVWHLDDSLVKGVWSIYLFFFLSKSTSSVLGPARIRIQTLMWVPCGSVWHGDTLWCDLPMINQCHFMGFMGCRSIGQSNLFRRGGSMICLGPMEDSFLAQGITPWVVVEDPPCPRRRRIPSSSSGGDVLAELFYSKESSSLWLVWTSARLRRLWAPVQSYMFLCMSLWWGMGVS